ncbi:MAG: amidohydrolase family protein [Planctomycetota bacterium]
MLRESAGLIGSVGSNARYLPGFWEPRLPATADIGLGFENRQFPRSIMGAVIAIRELLAFAKGDGSFAEEYGHPTGEVLRELLKQRVIWRMRADTDEEVAALVELFGTEKMPLVIEGLGFAGNSASMLAKAGYTVIYEVQEPNLKEIDRDLDAERPDPKLASKLNAAGVPFAIQGWSPNALRYAAGFAMRGGLDAQTALDGITSRAAEAIGVADRVGSLRVGLDGDLVVYNGAPLDAGTSVLATIVSGDVVYDSAKVAEGLESVRRKQAVAPGMLSRPMPAPPTVLSVEELHLGNGEVLSPGEILMRDGRIIEVGAKVARPGGAVVVKGFAAMPGVVDTMGFLGMEGSNPRINERFDMTRILEPGDALDRRVALAGVTTVNLTSAGNQGMFSTMAYKPSPADIDAMVVRNNASLVVDWPGDAIPSLLNKDAEYENNVEKYKKALAEWKEKPKKAEKSDDDKKEKEKAEEGESDSDKEKKDDKKKKNKKKPDAMPVTGSFEAQVTLGGKENQKLRVRILEGADGKLEGTLRMADHPNLVPLEGTREEYTVRLSGVTTEGGVLLVLEQGFEENDPEVMFLEGRRLFKGVEDSFKLPRTSPDYPVVKRPTPAVEDEDAKKKESGSDMPTMPQPDPYLAIFRGTRDGTGSLIVRVSREDHIRSLVELCAKNNIRPVLLMADEAHLVAEDIRGKVAGVILTQRPVEVQNLGMVANNRYARLQEAGIPVAFASMAESGAAGLVDYATLAALEDWTPQGALRALTADAADMLSLGDEVGKLKVGNYADVLLLDGPPLVPSTMVQRVWVNGREVQR